MDDVASSPLITVMCSRHASMGLSTNGYSVSAPCCGSCQYSGAQPCGLKMPAKRGTFGSASALASGCSAGIIESSKGSARETPSPFSSARLGMCLPVMNIVFAFLLAGRAQCHFSLPIHLERLAFHDAIDQRRETIVTLRGIPHDGAHYRHVLILNPASQCVGKKVFRP